MWILLVDDDKTARHALARLLATQGYTDILEAADGQDALEILDDQPADLVITDLHMPRRDGLGLLRELRLGGWTMPVILLSASDDPQVSLMAQRAGVDSYLRKPVDADALLGAVNRALIAPLAQAG